MRAGLTQVSLSQMSAHTAAKFAIVLVAGVLTPLHVAAQDIRRPSQEQTEHIWSTNRPDGHAPIGIRNSLLLEKGQLRFDYRYDYTRLEGFRAGTDSLDLITVFDQFPSLPLVQEVNLHRFTVTYGANDWLTLTGSVPVIRTTMDNLTDTDVLFDTEADGIGDIEVRGLFSILDQGPHRAHIQLGLSLPSGSIDETGGSEFGETIETQLPYQMQLGSGSADLLPGVTFATQNEFGTVGAQVQGAIRLTDNDRDYRLGNRLDANLWLAYRINDYLSVSFRIAAATWEEVDGQDPDLDPERAPTARPDLQGGTRVDIPFGLNVLFPEGPLTGHRLAFEALWPIHQDLDGPQLQRDWGFVIGWQKTLF